MIATHVGLFVLAVAPGSRGFGYAVFEDLTTIVDWQTKEIRNRDHETALNRLNELLHIFQPGTLVLEDMHDGRILRHSRILALTQAMATLAIARGTSVRFIRRRDVHRYFSPKSRISKRRIAEQIVEALPELRPALGAPRKLWQSERLSVKTFEACSLAMTHLAVTPSV